jgi:Cytochrome c554 and c-prime
MPRLLLPLGLIVIAVGLAGWVGRPRAAEPLAPPVEPADATKREKFAPVGVSGCAAAACHHGNDARGSKGSEYSTWIAVDPHAKAFAALSKPESIRMHKAMTGRDKGVEHNPLCLKCHGMSNEAPEALQADGVGCERCHGNAEKWKATHYLRDFDREQGFVDLRKLPVRVESCVKCHVGDGSMEVDHDLIAAGHPRLRFEYAAYSANYPRHWAETPSNKSEGDEVRGWLLGQIVSARGAAELLAHRAANKPDAWPEFAEYDCAACHHSLAPNFRKERDDKLVKAGKPIPLGRMPWGTWYNPLLPTLAKATKADGDKLDASRKRLEGLMQKSFPNTGKVREEAKTFAAQLRAWEKMVAGPPFNPNQVRALMKSLAGRPELVASGWDGGTQVYLGLAALNYGLTENGKPTPFLAPLQQMRKGLADAYPKGGRPRYDIPSDYDPTMQTKSLKSILKGLESRDAPHD